jgi:sugar phosphate permease
MAYRWAVLAIGTAAQAVYAAFLVAVPILAPALRDEYDLSLGGIGLVLAAVTGGQVLTQYAWGLLNDRFGERAALPLGLGCAGASLLVAAATTRLGLVVASLVGAGMFATSVGSATGRAIMGWFGFEERGLALGIRQASVPLGGAAAAFTLPVALHHGGLPRAFFVLAVGCLTVAALSAVGLREPPLTPADVAGAGTNPLRDRRLWRLTSGAVLMIFVQGAVLSFLVLFLHEQRGLSTGEAAAVLAATNIAGGALRLYFGFLSDRLARRLQPIRRLALVMAATVAAVAIAMEGSNLVLVPALIAAGAFAVSWNGLLVTATAELAGRARTGAALGLQQTMLASFFASVGPVFAALIAATSWQTAFALLTLLPLVSYTIFRPLGERGRAARAEA